MNHRVYNWTCFDNTLYGLYARTLLALKCDLSANRQSDLRVTLLIVDYLCIHL